MILGVTGHRPDKIGGCEPNPLREKIRGKSREILLETNPKEVLVGMALGFDTVIAEICAEENIPFVAAVPFLGQENRWRHPQQEHYRKLLDKASEVVFTGRKSSGLPIPALMQIRNRWIVDRCDRILACWDGTDGGTANCLKYARQKDKPETLIDPRTL